MKVPRNAWKPGAVWTVTNERGTLEAIIMGAAACYSKGKKNYKQVQMVYQNGFQAGRVIQSDYSHSHMMRHFIFTGKIGEVPKVLEK